MIDARSQTWSSSSRYPGFNADIIARFVMQKLMSVFPGNLSLGDSYRYSVDKPLHKLG